MFNLIHARFLPRLGLVTGAYLLWAVVFLSVGEFRVSPAENLVMVPVMLTAILFGMRGGAIGVLVPSRDQQKLIALRRVGDSVEEVLELELGSRLASNLAVVETPGGSLILGASTEDGQILIWQ